MNDIDISIRNALDANPLREPVFASAIRSLKLPPGSHGLDIGCGIGLQALLLAEAVSPAGHVKGIDIAPEMLNYAEKLAVKAGCSDQVSFCLGDGNRLPFENHAFDWVWSADCIGYPINDFIPLTGEVVRILKPGGSIILLGWSSQQLLPGYPLLEARLNACCSGYVPYFEGRAPERHFLRAKRWFQELGLEEIKTQTFVGDVQAPLSPGERLALVSLFDMLWGQLQPGTLPEDWKEFQRLCTPRSSDFIPDSQGYYAFFTYTLFQGRVPARKAS